MIWTGTTTGLNVINPETNEIQVITQKDGLNNDYIMCIYELFESSLT